MKDKYLEWKENLLYDPESQMCINDIYIDFICN